MAARAAQRWVWSYVAVALPLAVWLLIQAFPIVASTLHEIPYDGSTDWVPARAWWQGVNPFSAEYLRNIKIDGFGHPPTTPFWFLPLAHLDLQRMSLVVAELVVLLLFIELGLIATELKFPAPLVTATLLLGIVLTRPWMVYHLHLAQISELIAFLYVIAWLMLRRGRDTSSGIALGLACTLKLFPGLLVFCLLLARRFRAVVAALVVFVMVNIVMLARYGLAAWPDYLRGNAIITQYWIGNQRNASIHGVVLRALIPSCMGRSRPFPLATALSLVFSVALFLLLWRICQRAWRRAQTIDLPFAIFSLLSCFCNPWVWEHYNVFLILPLLLAIAVLRRANELGLGVGRVTAGAMVVGVVLVILGFLPVGYCSDLRDHIFANRRLHLFMHAAEIANWLPAVLMMALLSGLLYWAERRNRTQDLLNRVATSCAYPD